VCRPELRLPERQQPITQTKHEVEFEKRHTLRPEVGSKGSGAAFSACFWSAVLNTVHCQMNHNKSAEIKQFHLLN
jgi:hypothetical protein